MKKIFERKFIAIDIHGQSFVINDLAQLIEDYGLWKFFKTFGFSHGKISYESSFGLSYQSLKDWYATRKPTPEYEYVITDGSGRQYSPEYLLEQLFDEQPKRAKAIWDESTYTTKLIGGTKFHSQWKKRLKAIYRRARNTKVRGMHEILIEEGVKGIRNIGEYKFSKYSSCNKRRSRDKNWKKNRKTQYK